MGVLGHARGRESAACMAKLKDLRGIWWWVEVQQRSLEHHKRTENKLGERLHVVDFRRSGEWSQVSPLE